MNNRLLTGLIIGGAILTTATAAFAYGSQDGSGMRTGGGYGGDNPNREALEEAFENNDYSAWYNITLEAPKGEEILSIITEENFDKLVENLPEDSKPEEE